MMRDDIIIQRTLVYVLGESVARAKRLRGKYASLERQWIRETARLAQMEAGA